MAGRLAGKVAIVTGAAPQSPGIGNGSATAILFAREGATVILVNRSLSHAQTLQHTIEQEGGICAMYAADVSQAADVQRLVETVIQQYGKLDILVNNVGIFVPGTLETITEETWDTAMQVNVKGTMLCCKYSIPHMKAQGGGGHHQYLYHRRGRRHAGVRGIRCLRRLQGGIAWADTCHYHHRPENGPISPVKT